MSTTTIRLDDELKTRIAAAAERTGKTAHAFMVEALSQTLDQLERDDDFHRLADARWVRLLETGKSVPWDEAKAYLQARASGGKTRRPAARTPKA